MNQLKSVLTAAGFTGRVESTLELWLDADWRMWKTLGSTRPEVCTPGFRMEACNWGRKVSDWVPRPRFGVCPQISDAAPNITDCVNPADVHWVEGIGLPNAATVGRNTLFTGVVNNLDLTVLKSFPLGEGRKLEFRWEALNAFNHQQFTQVPERNVRNSPQGRFLNRDYTNSGIRSMWAQVKLLF